MSRKKCRGEEKRGEKKRERREKKGEKGRKRGIVDVVSTKQDNQKQYVYFFI
jgi:hypothetical protein